MWACRPRTSSPAAAQRSAACGSSASGMPNFESSWPVAILSWVSGRIPGVTRSRTRWPRPAATRSSRSISSSESTMMWPTPASTACSSSASALVVAVHVDPLGVEAGVQRQVELAAGGDVAGEPLLGEEPQRRRAGKGLAGEDDLEVVGALGEGGLDRPGAGAHVVLGVDVGGRAELGGELDHVAAADLDTAALVEPAADRVNGRTRYRVGQGLSTLRHETGIVTVARGFSD